jgi:hypothetical protein
MIIFITQDENNPVFIEQLEFFCLLNTFFLFLTLHLKDFSFKLCVLAEFRRN